MKSNMIKLIIPFFLLTFLFQACEEGDLITPDNTKNNREKWSYEFKNVMALSLPNNVPAIDEAGNIYVIADVQYGGEIIKLTSDGKEEWLKKENAFPLSRIIYDNQKLYYINSQMLTCRDANNGELLWETKVEGSMDLFALNNSKIYITRFVDIGIVGSNYLDAYSLDGDKIWETRIKYSDTDTISFPNTITVNGNNIYVGILAEVNQSEFAILDFVDQGNSATKNWSWLAPDNYSVGGGDPPIRNFAIDDDGNLIFGMANNNTNYIFSVSASGNENWRKETTLSKIIASVTVNGNGDCYVGLDKLEKINQNGIVWTSPGKPDWDYTGLTSNSPVIDKSGNLFYVDPSTMFTAVSSQGDSLWSQYYGCNLCNNVYYNVTINHNGDLIIASKAGVICYKGEGSALAENGWPKIYGDLGNTCSK